MKHFLTRVIYVLTLLFCLQLVAGESVMSAYAATPMTAQQKAKEKAKKEREKQKAKAAKEREKQKAQAAKQKAAAQKKASAQKSNTSAKNSPSQKSSQPKQEAPAKPGLSQEEAYAQRVREVEAYNAKVAAYQSRDIAHRLGFWGQVGYSSLLTGGYSHVPGAGFMKEGFDAKAKGGVGGGAGLGYQLRYKQMLFSTGLEFNIYNSLTNVYDGDNDYLTRGFGVGQYATMSYDYRFDEVRDKLSAGYLQIPVLFGTEHLDGLVFWQAGVKAGINMLGTSQLAGRISTSIHDTELADELINMLTHDVVTDMAYEPAKQKVQFGMNLALAAEVGIGLDRWMQPKTDEKKKSKPSAAQEAAKNLRIRISAFAEYGVLNTLKSSLIAADAQDMPIQLLTNAQKPLELPAGSILTTSAAKSAKVNPFLVGIRLAMYYELPRKQKKMLPMPTEPMPRMVFRVTDRESGAALNGVALAIRSSESDKVIRKTTNRSGEVVAAMARGSYDVHAEHPGYVAEDDRFTLRLDLKDTLRIKMTPEPKPVVYQLSGYVYDHDSHKALEAQVRMMEQNDNSKVLYEGGSSDEGYFMTALAAGQYMAHVEAVGYMPYDGVVTAVDQPVSLYLQKIREGVKVKINHLYFATNKTTILPASEQALDDLAQFMLANEGVTIRITGHTDAVGSDEANMRLSEGRAAEVKTALVKRGIDATRIESEGKGESEPIATNDTEEGRAQNRRVEFVITSTDAVE